MTHAFAASAAADGTLASVSDGLVIAMIVAYAVALFLFAIEAAYGRRRPLKANRLVPAAEVSAPAAGAAGDDFVARSADDGMTVNVRHAEPEARASQHAVGHVALAVTVAGCLLNLGQIVTRGIAADRWPWGNMFEFVVAISLCGVVAFLYAAYRYQARYLGLFVLIPVVLLLGIGAKWLYTETGPVIPALDSYWIAIHVSAAIVASGAFMVAGSATVTYLIAHRTELKRAAGETVTGIAGKLPSSELLDRVAHRFILFAFPLWTFAVIAGAIWADEAWGRYWGWDPKEVWSFITWTVYAAYLHARATAGWRGSRAAWIALAGFACLLFNFFGVNYLFSGLHSYA
ncbi:c-type cytochrome biogenesis protein CcsB [Allosalinactinospora lopnorensis]|uniref:c-type cytochrome biogenesis protein CcsB n=1 Tax=Allosalinactinospora lopnorensis TaxID=1352348 RepID=UPI000623E5FE|nr:c-type cytochrome biogenesis protein CcsB [Allosalinactinospora lopnorensis]